MTDFERMFLARLVAFKCWLIFQLLLIISYMLPTHVQPRCCNEKITGTALQINIIYLPVTMNRKIKKPPVKLYFR